MLACTGRLAAIAVVAGFAITVSWALLFGSLVPGRGVPAPADAVRGFEAAFDAYGRLGVTRLNTVGCDFFVYTRGAFDTDPTNDDCLFDVLNPAPRLPFDARARADLDALLDDTAIDGHPIAWAWIIPGAGGRVGAGSDFGFDGEWPLTYVYAPGTARSVPAQDDSSCAEPVNDDWYRSWGC